MSAETHEFIALAQGLQEGLAHAFSTGGIHSPAASIQKLTSKEADAMQTFMNTSFRDDGFFTAWPADLDLAEASLMDSFVALVQQARKYDARLQRWCDKLVPKRVVEQSFWRNYFSHVNTLLLDWKPSGKGGVGGTAAAAADGLAGAAAAMTLSDAGARASAGAPASAGASAPSSAPRKLQSSGAISRELALEFFGGATAKLTADSSLEALGQLYTTYGLSALNEGALKLQLDHMESLGIQNAWGCTQLQPPLLLKQFPNDEELKNATTQFMNACAGTFNSVMDRLGVPESERPGGGSQKAGRERRYAAASELQQEGELSREQVLSFCARVQKELMGADALETLASESDTQSAGRRAIQLQRELLEAEGIEQEFGCRSLGSVPVRFIEDPEVMRAFKAFQTACVLALKKSDLMRGERTQQTSVLEQVLPKPEAGAPMALRFKVGDKVLCRVNPTTWAPGKVKKLHYSEPHFPPGRVVPYQVQLQNGSLIFAPHDHPEVIKARDEK